MLLTHENLHAVATSNGGFNRKQIELLGLKWPPRKGWLKNLIGSYMDEEDYKKMMKLKSFTKNKKIVNTHSKIKEAFDKMTLEDQIRTTQLMKELKTLVNKYQTIQTYEQK